MTPLPTTRSMRRLSLVVLAFATACGTVPRRTTGTASATPAGTADALLAADRAFAAAANGKALPTAIGDMLTDGARMPARGETLTGRAAIVAALASTPDSAARAHWVPVRVGIAADGEHGFTVGFLFATRPDGTRAPYKYLAYWVRDDGRWRAAAWRRRPMETVAIDSTMLPPLLPDRLVRPLRNASTLAQHRDAVIAAEAEFSALAQRIGVGAAFTQRGVGESLNVGPPNQGFFTRGAEAIGRQVAGAQPLDAPSTIVWGADTAIAASSGDLGITFGVIRPKAGPPGAGAAFFTIWRKVDGVWRYVAE